MRTNFRGADVPAVLGLWATSDAEPTHTDDVESLTRLMDADPEALVVAVDNGIIVGSVLLVGLLAFTVLYQRCGLNGCPDVDMLKGYMPDQASTLVDKNGEEIAKLFVTRRVVVPVDSMPG